MAVIVTGMDVPQWCDNCRFCTCSKSTDYCVLTKSDDYKKCPLKSVDGLIKKIEQQQKVISLLKGLSGAEEMKGINDCIKIIKEYCGLEESNADND